MTALTFPRQYRRTAAGDDDGEADGRPAFALAERADARAGFRPHGCQWLERALPDRATLGRRPRAEEIDACKCGAPVALGRSYCASHLERAIRRMHPVAAMRAADRLVARIFAGW